MSNTPEINEMLRQKAINTVSMSKRAGKLLLGFDLVKDSVMLGKTQYVFVCSDLSEKSLKEVRFFCEEYGAQIIKMPVTMDEVLFAVSKKSGIIAVLDMGLNKKLRTLCADLN